MLGWGRRKQYRVKPAFDGELRCWHIEVPDGPDGSELTVVDHSAGGVGLFAQGELAGLFPGGHEVIVRLRVKGSIDRLDLSASVVRLEPNESGAVVGLSYLHAEETYRAMPLSWWRFFNRRKSFRAPFVGDQGPEAWCGGQGLSVSGHLLDVSTKGACVVLPQDVSGRLVPGTRMKLRFSLPGVTERFVFEGQVVHATPSRDAVACGFSWEAENCVDWERRSEDLVRFTLSNRQAGPA